MLVDDLKAYVDIFKNRHDKISKEQLEEFTEQAVEAARKGESMASKELNFKIIHDHPNRNPVENDLQCIVREICEQLKSKFGVKAYADMSSITTSSSVDYQVLFTMDWR